MVGPPKHRWFWVVNCDYIPYRSIWRRKAGCHFFFHRWRLHQGCHWQNEPSNCFHEVNIRLFNPSYCSSFFYAFTFTQCVYKTTQSYILFVGIYIYDVNLYSKWEFDEDMHTGVQWRWTAVWVQPRNSHLTSSHNLQSCKQ